MLLMFFLVKISADTPHQSLQVPPLPHFSQARPELVPPVQLLMALTWL